MAVGRKESRSERVKGDFRTAAAVPLITALLIYYP